MGVEFLIDLAAEGSVDTEHLRRILECEDFRVDVLKKATEPLELHYFLISSPPALVPWLCSRVPPKGEAAFGLRDNLDDVARKRYGLRPRKLPGYLQTIFRYPGEFVDQMLLRAGRREAFEERNREIRRSARTPRAARSAKRSPAQRTAGTSTPAAIAPIAPSGKPLPDLLGLIPPKHYPAAVAAEPCPAATDRARDDLDAALVLAAQAQGELERANQRAEEERTRVRQLRAHILWLEGRLRDAESRAGGEPEAERVFPDSWDGLERWVEEHHGGRLYLHPSAARAARKSVFADIPFAYRVLDMLGTDYQPVCAGGGEDARRRLAEAQKALRVEISHIGAALDHAKTQEMYGVPYRGRRRYATMHVCGSSSRNPTKGFRLYFFFDDEDEVVVITSLPSHLENSHS